MYADVQANTLEYEMRFAARLVRAGVNELYALDVAAQRFPSADPETDAAEWLEGRA